MTVYLIVILGGFLLLIGLFLTKLSKEIKIEERKEKDATILKLLDPNQNPDSILKKEDTVIFQNLALFITDKASKLKI